MSKTFNRRLAQILGIMVLISLVLVACGTGTPAPEEPGEQVDTSEEVAEPSEGEETEEEMAEENTLTIAVSGDIAGWDPVASIYWLANEVIINTHDTLVDYGPATDAEGRPIRDITEIVPRLAESWEVSDDGMSYTFKIREGAQFNNGDPVYAEAVKKSFERILNYPSLASFLLADVAFVRDPSQMVVEDEFELFGYDFRLACNHLHLRCSGRDF